MQDHIRNETALPLVQYLGAVGASRISDAPHAYATSLSEKFSYQEVDSCVLVVVWTLATVFFVSAVAVVVVIVVVVVTVVAQNRVVVVAAAVNVTAFIVGGVAAAAAGSSFKTTSGRTSKSGVRERNYNTDRLWPRPF